MKGDTVPDTDHIARRCGGSRVKEDGTISGEAFRLRGQSKQTEESLEDPLSVNWLEYLKREDRAAEIGEIQRVLAAKLELGPRSKIAVLNVGEMRSHVRRKSEDKRVLQVLHEPEEDVDPSHSGIHNLKFEDATIADLIAQTVKEIYPAKGD